MKQVIIHSHTFIEKETKQGYRKVHQILMQTCHIAYKEQLITSLLFDDYLIWVISFITQLTLSSVFNKNVQILMPPPQL